MAKDLKDSATSGGGPKSSSSSSSPQLASSFNQSLADKLDLDKNPIQFKQYDGTLSTDAHDKAYMELTLRAGKHSELAKQIMRQRIEQRAKEFPRWPGSESGGVRAVWIESRFWYDRERFLPDYDADWRMYRAKYLHSLELDPREPLQVPEYERQFLNPIRRFYMKGGDFIEDNFIKRFTKHKVESAFWRVIITRGFMIYLGLISGYYWLRYTNRQWDYMSGLTLYTSCPKKNFGHPEYPFKDYRTEPAHHFDLGFSRRKAWKDLRDFEDSTVL